MNQNQKRLRSPTSTLAMLRRRFSSDEKGKTLEVEKREEERPDCLLVKISHAVGIDKDFRRVTSNRFYGVKLWIRPDEEYSTQLNCPNYWRHELDPVWEEVMMIPIGQQMRVEDTTLRFELVRALRVCDATDPGPSNLRWVVGRAQLPLDRLLESRHEKLRLSLIRKDEEFGLRPEGHIYVELALKMVPAADDRRFF